MEPGCAALSGLEAGLESGKLPSFGASRESGLYPGTVRQQKPQQVIRTKHCRVGKGALSDAARLGSRRGRWEGCTELNQGSKRPLGDNLSRSRAKEMLWVCPE